MPISTNIPIDYYQQLYTRDNTHDNTHDNTPNSSTILTPINHTRTHMSDTCIIHNNEESCYNKTCNGISNHCTEHKCKYCSCICAGCLIYYFISS